MPKSKSKKSRTRGSRALKSGSLNPQTLIMVMILAVIGLSAAYLALAGRRGNSIAFKAICDYSHTNSDDPIVYPGQVGKAHAHQFFGNKTTNAFSTNESLRAASKTTCRIADEGYRKSDKFTADKAAYWVPAVYDNGKEIPPSHTSSYYNFDPELSGIKIKTIPDNLRIIAGNAQASGPQSLQVIEWMCRTFNGTKKVGDSKTAIPRCASDQMLAANINFPQCWDGVNADFHDHKSHMAYATSRGCPATHPIQVPQLSMHVHWPGTRGGTSVNLAIDPNTGRAVALHADFMNGWDPARFAERITSCLNNRSDCTF